MVVYLDSVFIINTLVNYFLLRLTARLMHAEATRFRCALSAAIGGGYAVAVFLSPGQWLADAVMKLALGVLLCLVAFGKEKFFFKLTVLFLALSCALAGCVLAINLLAPYGVIKEGVYYFDADWRVFFVAAAVIYGFLRLLFAKDILHGARNELVEVKLWEKGRSVAFRALCDTGNTLCDPMTGKRVLLVEQGVAAELLSPKEVAVLKEESSAVEQMEKLAKGENHRFFLLPYRAVGTTAGMLLAMRCEKGEIGGKKYNRLPIAILREKLTGEGTYEGLWSGNN